MTQKVVSLETIIKRLKNRKDRPLNAPGSPMPDMEQGLRELRVLAEDERFETKEEAIKRGFEEDFKK